MNTSESTDLNTPKARLSLRMTPELLVYIAKVQTEWGNSSYKRKILNKYNVFLVDEYTLPLIKMNQPLLQEGLSKDEELVFDQLELHGLDGVLSAGGPRGIAYDFINEMVKIYHETGGFDATCSEAQQLNNIVLPTLKAVFLHRWDGKVIVQNDRFKITDDGRPANHQLMADGGLQLVFPCSCPLLVVEGKKTSHAVNKAGKGDTEKIIQYLSKQLEDCTHKHKRFAVIAERESWYFYVMLEENGQVFFCEIASCLQ